MRLSSQSSGSTFPLLRLYYKVAPFEPELREHVSFTTAVLQSWDFRGRAPGARFLYYGCTTKLGLSSQSSGSTFPLLRLYYKLATFEPELREHVSYTTAVLQRCDFRARAPGARFPYYGCTTAVLQSCDFQARAPGTRYLYYGCTTKLRLSSQSSGSTFPLRPAGCANQLISYKGWWSRPKGASNHELPKSKGYPRKPFYYSGLHSLLLLGPPVVSRHTRTHSRVAGGQSQRAPETKSSQKQRNVRLKRFYGTEQGDHSCKQAYTEQKYLQNLPSRTRGPLIIKVVLQAGHFYY